MRLRDYREIIPNTGACASGFLVEPFKHFEWRGATTPMTVYVPAEAVRGNSQRERVIPNVRRFSDSHDRAICSRGMHVRSYASVRDGRGRLHRRLFAARAINSRFSRAISTLAAIFRSEDPRGLLWELRASPLRCAICIEARLISMRSDKEYKVILEEKRT